MVGYVYMNKTVNLVDFRDLNTLFFLHLTQAVLMKTGISIYSCL